MHLTKQLEEVSLDALSAASGGNDYGNGVQRVETNPDNRWFFQKWEMGGWNPLHQPHTSRPGCAFTRPSVNATRNGYTPAAVGSMQRCARENLAGS